MIFCMKKILYLIGFIALCEAVGIAGSVFTSDQIETWYRAVLVLPSFTPPNWLFGPVWTTLYALMGYALYTLWYAQKNAARTHALTAFWIQLALNAIWTPVFFGAHALGLAFLIIILMFAAILATMILGYRVKPVVAWLLLPYLLWVGFASTLNGAIWWLN